jgi:ArsR family transcriptional regulator
MPNATLPLLPTQTDACCAPSEPALDTEGARRLAAVLKAIAEPTRLRLLSMVAAKASGEACICDLTAPVALSQPTVSHHMKTLVDAGLLTREQRGKWAYYRMVPSALASVAGQIAKIGAAPVTG